MKKQILFPVDFQSEVHLADYANLLSHVDKKNFMGFFLRDFVKSSRIKPIDADKQLLQQHLQQEAELLKLDFDVLKSHSNASLLVNQSRFADLVIVNALTSENILQLNHLFPDHFFDLVACPVFLLEDVMHPFEEVLVLFDYDHSGLVALKAFLSFFGKISCDKKVTLLIVSPDDLPEIHLEKYLVSYLQKIFKDVGIVPLSNQKRVQQVMGYATKLSRPVLVMGRAANDLLNNEELAGQLTDHHVSVFYSNV